ncbi:MAG: DUF4831 family protein [Flavobacterium piscis]|nr:DUF4831 family protein [Flavobacterium piscis]
MKKLIFAFSLVVISIMSFGQIYSFNINDPNKTIKENVLVYYLPKVVFDVIVTVETEYFIPGPFARFAEKYLSIKNVNTEARTFSEIKSVEVKPMYQADQSACFGIVPGNKKINLVFNNTGIIKSLNTCIKAKDFEFSNNLTITPNYVNTFNPFTNISVNRNFTDITDTTYQVIQVDSVFQKIPVFNKRITSKSLEQKAEEAANFILLIRNRKFNQISGFFEIEAPSVDLPFMVSEMDKLEKEFLELFIGKTIKVENKFRIFYNTTTNGPSERKILFYLSNEFGIQNNIDADYAAQPVELILASDQNQKSLAEFYNRQTELKQKTKKFGLFYCVPSTATLKVVCADHTYFENKYIVPQFGYINYLPAKLMKNKNLKIEFDEQTGSIISIKNE